ncbi:MAG: MCE family protein [Frankiaceae bacterium]|nr:MCE family protein [Frankiaceae bacterium]MBV9872325.1 MCE family protein [Frankiaceae bacterium]
MRRLQGLVFLLVIALLLGLTIVIYDKKLPFGLQSSDHVTLQAHRIGNQLIIPADVKYQGVLVGRVSSVHSDGENATLNLELSKSKINQIPHNVVARILPKTLFGEKFVDLINPPGGSPIGHLDNGQVIQQDQSHVAVELQDVFSKLVPVLRAVKPQYLSVALSNTAQALRGRGNELGQNLELINNYFSQLNKDLPNIQHNIGALADLASNYADATPDLLGLLRNFSVTARTFTIKRDSYAQFIAGTAGFATTATKFFHDNGPGLIKLAKQSVGPLGVAARYSIVLECLPRGLSIFDRQRLEHAFQGGELHIDLIPVNDRGVYTQAEKPKLSEFTNAVLPPNCYGLPYGNHGLHPENSKYPFAPGGNYDKGGFSGSAAPAAKPATAGSTEGAGSTSEQSQISTIIGQIAGGQSNLLGLNDLLLGPMLRGMAVRTR